MNTKVSLDEDEKGLLKLRDSMSEQQRSEMAEIIGNELKRRESLKYTSGAKSNVKASGLSGGLGAADLKDLYESTDKNIQQLRVKALENKVKEAKKDASRFGVVPSKRAMSSTRAPLNYENYISKLPVVLFGLGIIAFAGLKSIKTVNGAPQPVSQLQSENTSSRASLGEVAKPEAFKEIDSTSRVANTGAELSVKVPTTEAEKAVLLQLDQRRVELERRRIVLDQKEKELIVQAKLVTEKITELKSLTNKLAALRTEKNSKFEARLDQLASVYGAMAPNDASGLIARLDEEVALSLLERMPEKRMAQILGVMEQSRAIELTKSLTNRKLL